MKTADALWKIRAIELWGQDCEICLQPASIIHHYVPRSRNALLRFDLANAIPICTKCHYSIHFDRNPDKIRELAEAIRQSRGKEWCDYIDSVKMILGRSFQSVKYYEETIEYLS